MFKRPVLLVLIVLIGQGIGYYREKMDDNKNTYLEKVLRVFSNHP